MKKFIKVFILTAAVLSVFTGCASDSSNYENSQYDSSDNFEQEYSVMETTPFSQYSITDTGYCGKNNESDIIWNYYSDISAIEFIGVGEIADYSYYDQSNDIPWYDYRESIQQVYISDGITRIGNRVFEQFKSLTQINIPSSVTSIGEYQFWACDNLTDIYFSNSVVEIEDCAFGACDSLSAIHYNGTQNEWDLINIAEDVFLNTTQEVSLYFE